MADVDAAVSNLFHHPNVGPFIGRLLIQRLVTSNPSPAYVARVSAAFDAAPRGDLGRTVKAILMDSEARDPAKIADPTFGKLREPFLKVVNFARAFNATSAEGWYYLSGFDAVVPAFLSGVHLAFEIAFQCAKTVEYFQHP